MSYTDRKPLPPNVEQDPIDRQMTRLSVEMCYGEEGLKALDDRRCPSCKKPITTFRDKLSAKEYGISGFCQECQNEVFDPKKNEAGEDDWQDPEEDKLPPF